MTGKAKKGSDERLVWLLKANVHFAAAALLVVGIGFLCACSGRNVLFRQSDALLGLHNRTLLALLAMLHLGLGVWLLATRNLLSQGLMILWLGVNCLVYHVGLAWLKAAAPLPVVKLVAWKLGAKPNTVDASWKLLIACLVVGGLVHSLAQHRHLKRLKSESFIRHWEIIRRQGDPAPRADLAHR
jgi:hypothetical protein